MSFGLVGCSKCRHEIHQDRDENGNLFWYHCDDKSRICEGATSLYLNRDGIVGKACYGDELNGCWDGGRHAR